MQFSTLSAYPSAVPVSKKIFADVLHAVPPAASISILADTMCCLQHTVRAAAEAERMDLVARLVIADEKGLGVVDVGFHPVAEGARQAVEEISVADALIVVDDLQRRAIAFATRQATFTTLVGEGTPLRSRSALFRVPSQHRSSLFIGGQANAGSRRRLRRERRRRFCPMTSARGRNGRRLPASASPTARARWREHSPSGRAGTGRRACR